MKYNEEINEILEKISDINYLLENYLLLTKYVESTKGKRDLKINDQFKHRIFRKGYSYNKKTKIRKPVLTGWGKSLLTENSIRDLNNMRISLLMEI